jgi:hypothetical protein
MKHPVTHAGMSWQDPGQHGGIFVPCMQGIAAASSIPIDDMSIDIAMAGSEA